MDGSTLPSRHTVCRKKGVNCNWFPADCGQTTRPGGQRRAGEGRAAIFPSCAAECCSHAGPFAEDALLSYKLVINAKFLSLFSLWLSFIREIKEMRWRGSRLPLEIQLPGAPLMTLETFVQSLLPLWRCRSNAAERLICFGADVLDPVVKMQHGRKGQGKSEGHPMCVRVPHS